MTFAMVFLVSFKAVGIWMGSPGGTVSEAPATLKATQIFSRTGVSENILRETPIPSWYININIYIYMYNIYNIYIYIM